MSALTLAVPGDPHTRTGGYLYDRRLAAGLERRGWHVDRLRLSDDFPWPDGPALAHASASLAALPDERIVIVDGLALGAMPEVAAHAAQRLRLVALVHHPLAHESGLEPAQARALRDSERHALAAARLVIVTSDATAALLEADYAVARQRLLVAEPGTDRAPAARGSAGGPPSLLCVATITPRKGHDLLVAALARLRHLDWSLTCAGSDTRSPCTARRVRAAVHAAGLAGRVEFTGEVDDATLAGLYDRADAFVLPTRLEGYGMALAEAIARGLPVITSAGGAAAATTGADAALLVPVDDVDALSRALAALLGDAPLRRRLAAAARRRAAALPDWERTAERVDGALRRLAGA